MLVLRTDREICIAADAALKRPLPSFPLAITSQIQPIRVVDMLIHISKSSITTCFLNSSEKVTLLPKKYIYTFVPTTFKNDKL